mgnify:FL=1|jgi:hypothetical protein
MKAAYVVLLFFMFAQGCANTPSSLNARGDVEAASVAILEYLKAVTPEDMKDVDMELTFNRGSSEILREELARLSPLNLRPNPAGKRKVSISAKVVERTGKVVSVNVTFRESESGMTSALYHVEKHRGGWRIIAITDRISS